MKFKMAAVAALIICSLYGCGSNRDSTSSIYTPAPITPRPTFDTTRYRTEEEITAKQDEDFVIFDSTPAGGYPSVQSEYIPVIVTDNEAELLLKEEAAARAQQAYEKAKQAAETSKNNYTTQTSVVLKPETNQPESVETANTNNSLRSKDSIPEGFSSKKYPYSLYSFDGRVYLGKISTDITDADSIWNTTGIYGSPDSAKSIFNPQGVYGSSNSMFSAFNDNATAPPRICDSTGNIVGELSTNLRIADGIDPDELKLYAADNGM